MKSRFKGHHAWKGCGLVGHSEVPSLVNTFFSSLPISPYPQCYFDMHQHCFFCVESRRRPSMGRWSKNLILSKWFFFSHTQVRRRKKESKGKKGLSVLRPPWLCKTCIAYDQKKGGLQECVATLPPPRSTTYVWTVAWSWAQSKWKKRKDSGWTALDKCMEAAVVKGILLLSLQGWAEVSRQNVNHQHQEPVYIGRFIK